MEAPSKSVTIGTVNHVYITNHYYYPGKTCSKCGIYKPFCEFYNRDSTCKSCRRERRKERYYEDPQKEIIRNMAYNRRRYLTDPVFRLKDLLRNRLRNALNRQGAVKSQSTMDLTGCNIEWLTAWLEYTRRYYAPYSTATHIDHLYPCAAYNLIYVEEQKKCFLWKNLRVVDAAENMAKHDRYPSPEEMETQSNLIDAFLRYYR